MFFLFIISIFNFFVFFSMVDFFYYDFKVCNLFEIGSVKFYICIVGVKWECIIVDWNI